MQSPCHQPRTSFKSLNGNGFRIYFACWPSPFCFATGNSLFRIRDELLCRSATNGRLFPRFGRQRWKECFYLKRAEALVSIGDWLKPDICQKAQLQKGGIREAYAAP